MAKVLITYDLKKHKDYPRLIEELKRLGACSPLLSVWVLNSSNTDAQLRDHLKQYIDSDDKLLVVGLNGGWASWNLTQTQVACMNAQVG